MAPAPTLSEVDVPAPPTTSTGQSDDGPDQGTGPEADSGSPEEVGADEDRPPIVEMDGAGSAGARRQGHEARETGPVFDAEQWLRDVEERLKELRERYLSHPE